MDEDQKENPEQEREVGVVYRRITRADDSASSTDSDSPGSRRWPELAPAIIPLIGGFLLLLVLIFMLGLMSGRRMDEVSVAVMDLEQGHAAKLSLLLKLRLATTKLNNEARARANAEARDELRPPFDLRLTSAQDELRELLEQAEGPPLGSDPTWQQFRRDLASFIEVTKDLRRYSLEGFEKFMIVDKQLDALFVSSGEEQFEVFTESERIEQAAARSIRSWSTMALILGAIIAAATIWEVQRRFAQMQRSVREASRERVFTSQMLEGMVSAIAAIDDNSRIRSANAAFFRIFPRASIGVSLFEDFASAGAAKMLAAANATVVDKATYRGRWVCGPAEGCKEEQTFDVYSSPLGIDGARGQILTLVDATEAAQAERGLRRQESLAAVGQATAQVAHEIRNPLGSIRLGVSMLRDSVNDKEGLNTIELVERGIKHLNKLVVDVAQFSSRKELERSKVDLHELIGRSLELVSDKISEKATPIKKEFTSEAVVGNWDPDQLRQVLVNVLGNAIDASSQRGPVTIATEVLTASSALEGQEFGPAKLARITISDQGPGIEKAVLDRIFEPFFSTKKRGTGLGLAIVKQIVEQHGGNITAESEPGEGARFVIELPL
ncbi:MAG TPA: ATP-binding protein [Pyrinomonadaceae bacterium]|nr:ATP-binding protein [Pyrinomonadaceae bacterium]